MCQCAEKGGWRRQQPVGGDTPNSPALAAHQGRGLLAGMAGSPVLAAHHARMALGRWACGAPVWRSAARLVPAAAARVGAPRSTIRRGYVRVAAPIGCATSADARRKFHADGGGDGLALLDLSGGPQDGVEVELDVEDSYATGGRLARLIRVSSVTLASEMLAYRPPDATGWLAAEGDEDVRKRQAPPCTHCRTPLAHLLLTTAGGEAWATYPLASDVWLCPTTFESAATTECTGAIPVFVGEPEMSQMLLDSAEAIEAGRLDDAEVVLRRAAFSWPGYPPPRANLALLYDQRLATRLPPGSPGPEPVMMLPSTYMRLVEERGREAEAAVTSAAAIKLEDGSPFDLPLSVWFVVLKARCAAALQQHATRSRRRLRSTSLAAAEPATLESLAAREDAAAAARMLATPQEGATEAEVDEDVRRGAVDVMDDVAFALGNAHVAAYADWVDAGYSPDVVDSDVELGLVYLALSETCESLAPERRFRAAFMAGKGNQSLERTDEAAQRFAVALALGKACIPADGGDYPAKQRAIVAANELVGELLNQGEERMALDVANEAVAVHRSGGTLSNVALASLARGLYEQAIRAAIEAIEVKDSLGGEPFDVNVASWVLEESQERATAADASPPRIKKRRGRIYAG